MGKGFKIELKKIDFKPGGSWKGWDELRKDPGVMQALRDTANEIGEVETSFTGYDRAHVIARVDRDTFDNLVASGKVIPRGGSDE